MMGRRLLIPEVIQTSGMDCGPAALKALLEGFGRPVSYGRLREACHTEVDGTSIDTLEEIANHLGLAATQVMVPPDHLPLPEAELLPALAIVKVEGGGTHFVVVWRRHGPWLQIMDPALGRRWASVSEFVETLYLHEQEVPEEAWTEWARGEGLLAPLRARMRRLGIGGSRAKALIQTALAAPDWRGLGALDAAVYLAQTAGVRSLVDLAARPDLIPADCWRVRVGTEGNVIFRAAVMLTCPSLKPLEANGIPASLRDSLDARPVRPLVELWKVVRQDGLGVPFAAATAALLAAGAVLVESLLLRALFSVSPHLPRTAERLTAAAVLVAFLLAVLLTEWGMEELTRLAGRRLELRLRALFYLKIPRLGDRYFQSRLISDMAQRAHAVQVLRGVPALAANLLRVAGALVATIAGIAWLFPQATLPALIAGVLAVSLPFVAQPWLIERDQRFREYAGALSRFYLDALLGIVPIRTHGAGPALRITQSSQLESWAGAGLRTQKAAAGFGALQMGLASATAAWLVYRAMSGADANPAALLLLVYWALSIPDLGRSLASVAWLWPALRNSLLRLLEPLGSPEEAVGAGALAEEAPAPAGGVSFTLRDLDVSVSGHAILRGVNLRVEAGEHIGIVGMSGAGKSSLVGLLLGWHKPTGGEFEVDGKPLDAAGLQALRRQTAWVDPQVQLWNESLLDNLAYGIGPDQPLAAGRVIEQANLGRVIQNLPGGLQSALGEGGALVSGGEGQRVRMGRAYGRPGVRLAILDEPARGLDRGMREEFMTRARANWRGATLLCITHDVASTKLFPRVLVIEHGQVLEDGDPAELYVREGSRYRQLCDREDEVLARLWNGAAWRRFRMDEGVLRATGEGA